MKGSGLLKPARYRARWGQASRYLRIYGVTLWRPEELPVSFEFASGPSAPHPTSVALAASAPKTTALLEAPVSGLETERIERTAEVCHSSLGVWPISFSYPSPSVVDAHQVRTRLVASVIPGEVYEFEDPDEYLSQYRTSAYGITHRKGGWDCFRHVEIMASGALPLMHDAHEIPEYSMVHYPKSALAEVYQGFLAEPRPPDRLTQDSFASHFNGHLTSVAMARYILRQARAADARSVLFVDENLADGVDYLSVLTLIGLHQLSEVSVTCIVPAPYVWTDWNGRARNLYGRGFGYSRVLDPAVRRNGGIVSLRDVKRELGKGSYDVVVFGSIMRNLRLYAHLRPHLDTQRTILINGEDLAADRRTLDLLTSTGSHVFVRALG